MYDLLSRGKGSAPLSCCPFFDGYLSKEGVSGKLLNFPGRNPSPFLSSASLVQAFWASEHVTPFHQIVFYSIMTVAPARFAAIDNDNICLPARLSKVNFHTSVLDKSVHGVGFSHQKGRIVRSTATRQARGRRPGTNEYVDHETHAPL